MTDVNITVVDCSTCPCPTGLTGVIFVPGATGPVGPQGYTGPAGMTGALGPTGAPGPAPQTNQMLFWSAYLGPTTAHDGCAYPGGYNQNGFFQSSVLPEANVETILLHDSTFRDLRVHLDHALTHDITFTLRVNQVDTGLTLTITSGNTTGFFSGTVSGSAGDRFSIGLTQTASLPMSTDCHVHIVCGLSF